MDSFRLQPCDILVNVNDRDDLYSRVKRWGVGPYDHVSLYLGRIGLFIDHRQRRILRVPMIFESVPAQGVCLRQLSERYGEKVVVMRLKSEHDRRRIPHVLLAAIDLASDDSTKYDFICIPLHIIPRILHEKFGMPIPVKYHRNPEQVCSEAVNEIFIRGRLELFYFLPWVPLPGDFVDSLLLEGVWCGDLSVEVI